MMKEKKLEREVDITGLLEFTVQGGVLNRNRLLMIILWFFKGCNRFNNKTYYC